ncbi:hypothetical protein BOTBODRAFT_575366 [Botryobasidium botryosum FD-172 SS1]|uniref:Thioredoxin-like fold domain-containing protein n=1 Tax=Botryobasidium botryosum (strain FD-172 SS1) TaxID=930990 RepID=A0A067MPK6_BOTB1|nr:hypothetical protein BOTBODRAFT_575366 [Botryobasidium botryosum FD-172 SS1]
MAQVTLYRFNKNNEKFDQSTWVSKLESYLVFSRTEHATALGDLGKAPRGKLPYAAITAGDAPTEMIADSEHVYDTLVSRGIAQELDIDLTAEQKALTVAMSTLVEQLYWLGVKERWIDNFYWARDKGPLRGLVYPMRLFIGQMVWRRISGVMTVLGHNARSQEELTTIRTKGLASLSALIGEKKYIHGGDAPTRIDAWVFGFLAASLCTPCEEWNPIMRDSIMSYENLKRYAADIQKEWFPKRPALF